MNSEPEKPDRFTVVFHSLIVILGMAAAFVLFWYRRDGAATFLTFLSASPTVASTAASKASALMQKASGEAAQVTTEEKTQ